MKTCFALLTFILCGSSLLIAQDSTSQFSYELSGGGSYGYSNSAIPPFNGETFSRYVKTSTVSIFPSVGYFASRNVEVFIAPEYSYQLQRYNYAEYSGNPITIIERSGQLSTHRIGLSLGIAYNYYLTPAFLIFTGTKIGEAWTSSGSQFMEFSWDAGWSKPELSFPQIIAGAKIFITVSWAVLLQGEYSFTDRFRGNPDQQVSRYVLAIGLSTFL